MNLAEDRRNPKVQRVELTTLVDICESGSKLPPFQGESANVSGRGMHLRTSHLPEVGQPLVCRFEHEGSEILVEGRVAWRSEGTDGGEFGVQFTAVDAGSADVLRRLKSGGSRNVPSFLRKTALVADETDDDKDNEDLEAEAPSMAVGDRVKLHIEGLASPMKASVQEAFSHKVRVGSNLEFLKMGRSIEIEQLKSGERQGARVDSINVVMNPSTSVPELVVMLRYDSEQASPAPGYTHDVNAEEPSDEEEESPDAPWHPAALALESRLSQAFGAATTSLKRATTVLSEAGAGAFRAAQGAATKVIEQRAAAEPKVKVAKAQPIRRTSERSRVRPSNVSNIGAKKARVSSHPGPSLEAKSKRRFGASRGMVALGLSVASAAALLLLWPKNKDVPPAAKIAAAPQPAAPAPVAAPPSAPAPKVSPEGIVAEVPLFGPRAITTTEPARATPADEAAAEKRAAAAEVPDETFATEESARPTTFARGKLNLPTVHRIRLDGAGSEVVGVVESKGFSVVVPGRKAMETGRAIEKRDRRILHVKSSNTAEGARILFEFRGPVPPYKVRLKNDFIEFLISAPEGTDAAR